MPATRNRPSQLSVLRYGAFVSRTAEQRVTAYAPTIRNLVHDHFGRRPLGAVTIILTKPRLLLSLAAEAQGEAAGVPENTWKSVGAQRILGKPKDLRVVTVIAPKGAMWMLINAPKMRDAKQLRLSLLRGFVEVDQLIRSGARENRVAWVRHEMNVEPLSKRQANKLQAQIRADTAEAERITADLARRL
ncbi:MULTISPECIES: hypothetical protein [unclassified Streptomyces]|uniref:hypothetical protein n=1 Tax=unclassified Streptomyces TaxID=2593676 RepID=UPI00136C619E|nr:MULTISPECIES: hypothetical protein [unclassified Streptomyces]NEA05824.1 hypothetical protein [Streptomyces sp. SID10116]MYY80849.1 hypothetical protein [Streptomyces sp. SID335]MYZ13296.1 hypothetical protein [Streptomyces sp. SID337]NDZ85693.1 hypothetical protein [Streptomyces sp. SID10115]NEB49975.1 hypothetical protein [Streptomyces sp. SID339]